VILVNSDGLSPFRSVRGNELLFRVCSALVLVPLAIATAYAGGWSFTVLWAAAAVIVLWEWTALIAPDERQLLIFIPGAVFLVVALGLLAFEYYQAALAAVAVGAAAAFAIASTGRRMWAAFGVLYAGVLAASPIVLRSDADSGFVAMLFLFVIVWATDTGAYFVGRRVGGPKLMPQISPQKTWSGALGGTAAAVLGGLAVAKAAALAEAVTLMELSAILSILAQGGDLFESHMKRKFGAKDSGRLIPGHGGLMDRLDGFVAAGFLAALIGVMRGGIETPARGLLVW
jgi:phosphatidate cytidylyltransferase